MSEDHKAEAERLLESRIADMRRYLELADEGVDVHDSEDMPEDIGPVYDYGLAWDKVTTDHREETVTYEHQLSTGGPGDEFHVVFELGTGVVDKVTFVYLPWFDRVEIDFDMEDEDSGALLKRFYETFFGYVGDI